MPGKSTTRWGVLTLALETSSVLGSVAVVRGAANPWSAEVLASSEARAAKGHGENLLPLIEQTLRAAWPGRDPQDALGDIELLAVGIGPGSFTGTRIAVATVKGLAVASRLPVVGVTSFEALAAGHPVAAGDRLAAVIDARKSEVYLAPVVVEAADVRLDGEAVHLPLTEARQWLEEPGRTGAAPWAAVVGDGIDLVFDRSVPGAPRKVMMGARPHAAFVGALAAARQHQRAVDQTHELQPLYVRPPDISTPKRAPFAPRRKADAEPGKP